MWTRCISTHSLNTIRCSMGNQCRYLRVAVTWSCGPRRATSRAAAFWHSNWIKTHATCYCYHPTYIRTQAIELSNKSKELYCRRCLLLTVSRWRMSDSLPMLPSYICMTKVWGTRHEFGATAPHAFPWLRSWYYYPGPYIPELASGC